MRADNFLFFWLCTKHRLVFTHRHRFASSAQRFDKDRLRLFIKASLPARGVTISGDDRRFACTFAAPTAATSVSAAGPRAGSTRGRVLFYFFQSLFSTQHLKKGYLPRVPFFIRSDFKFVAVFGDLVGIRQIKNRTGLPLIADMRKDHPFQLDAL